MKLCLLVPAAALLTTVTLGCSGSASDPIPGAGDEGSATSASDLTSAAVTLRVPLLDDKGKPLSKHNAQFKTAGLGTFPDSVELQGDGTGSRLPGTDKAFSAASDLVDKGTEKLSIDLTMLQLAEPYEYKTNNPATSICYTGNPKLVVPLIESLTDGVFSDQLSMHGWRYRQIKVLDDGISPEDEKTFPEIWKDWRGQGDTILTITASSDGGEQMNVGLIPVCGS